MSYFRFLKILTLTTLLSTPALADETVRYTPMLSGPLGLNTVPNARMDEVGTIRAQVSTLDPYVHGSLGFQLADPFYLSFRQSAEVSDITGEADRLYPGIDFKLRLQKESEAAPEIALGMQSAIGHKRMAGEYIALSKRYGNFDFTGGMGWGRYGSAGHMSNPLKNLSSHFKKDRMDEEMPNEPTNWFTGPDMGFFGGVEYFTPIDGLSIKADYGADNYTLETRDNLTDKPAPWSIGLNYAPFEWISTSIGTQGLDKVMARLSIQGKPSQWPFTRSKKPDPAPLAPARANGNADPSQMFLASEKEGIAIFALNTKEHIAEAQLRLEDYRSTPQQIGLAARAMANHGGADIEELTLTPRAMNLRGTPVSIMRSDLENAVAKHQGSAAEIWHNTSFETKDTEGQTPPPTSLTEQAKNFKSFHFILENQLSLSEEDTGIMHRSSLIAESKGPSFFGLLHTGAAVRLNLHDNLERLKDIRPAALLPVRSDVYDFADNRVGLERLYSTYTHSFTPDTHMAITGGYLEEMYGGLGGEVLYRPFGKRYAFGAESWLAFKRDPSQQYDMGFNGDSLLSGHLNSWYDLDNNGLTLHAKAGRFLAEDTGVELALSKEFDNGAKLDAFVTMTDMADYDLFGGTTHAYHGVRLSLPLGSVPYVPQGSVLNTKLEPFGRDIGQSIDNPVPLYEITNAFSKDHLARYWGDVTGE